MSLRLVVASIIVFAAGISILFLLKIDFRQAEAGPQVGGGKPTGPRALVLTDLGDCADDVAQMKALGWTVKTAKALELEMMTANYGTGLSDYKVVWVPGETNHSALRRIMRKGGPLDRFAKEGGVVSITNLTPEKRLLDIAPGGTDASPLPAGGAGPVCIKATDHPMIVGYFIGGMPLVPQALDTKGTGGRACIDHVPEGCDAVVVAANAMGPVVVDYKHGKGRVFISALKQEGCSCRQNAMLYVQSVAK